MFDREGSVETSENVIKVIDMERSGATIAFDYFKEKLMMSSKSGYGFGKVDQSMLNEFERVRQLYDYIEDGDLWRWKLQNSKAFSSGLKDLNIEFDVRLNPSLFEQVIVYSWSSSSLHFFMSWCNIFRQF